MAISFTSGETVLEEPATRLLTIYGLITLACLVPLLRRRPAYIRALLYALLWLALPIIAVLLLASAVPKFNACYVMIALPGLILMWGTGLAALAGSRGRRESSAAPSSASGVAPGLALNALPTWKGWPRRLAAAVAVVLTFGP